MSSRRIIISACFQSACKYSLDWHSTDHKTTQYIECRPQTGRYFSNMVLSTSVLADRQVWGHLKPGCFQFPGLQLRIHKKLVGAAVGELNKMLYWWGRIDLKCGHWQSLLLSFLKAIFDFKHSILKLNIQTVIYRFHGIFLTLCFICWN